MTVRPLFAAAVLALFACSAPVPVDLVAAPDGGAPAACAPCVSSEDCSSGACALLANDSVCAATCRTDFDCAVADKCVEVPTAEGETVHVCLPRDGSCGEPGDVEEEPADAGVEPPGDWCGLLAGPQVDATNCECSGPEESCAPNHCFGGWYCDTAVGNCVPPPVTCDGLDGGIDDPDDEEPDAGVDEPAHDAGTASHPDAGTSHPDAGTAHPDAGTPPPPHPHIDPKTGGTATRLRFAVVGDTRPPRTDDTHAYPVRTIEGIYGAIKNLSPEVDFVVTTGDYMFASPNGSESGPQMNLYMHARHQLSQPLWPALGNHECFGGTSSNCGPEAGHATQNYHTFIDQMMRPIGETVPYFSRRVDQVNGHWSMKIVVVAPNAWGPIQKAWLERELSKPTTYTFVIHHEPSGATTAPGIPDINRIVSRHPVTLSIVGHTHTWSHVGRQVIVGNGGAPLTANVPYGYTLITRRSDGAVVVTGYDYKTGHAHHSFAVRPDGSAAP